MIGYKAYYAGRLGYRAMFGGLIAWDLASEALGRCHGMLPGAAFPRREPGWAVWMPQHGKLDARWMVQTRPVEAVSMEERGCLWPSAGPGMQLLEGNLADFSGAVLGWGFGHAYGLHWAMGTADAAITGNGFGHPARGKYGKGRGSVAGSLWGMAGCAIPKKLRGTGRGPVVTGAAGPEMEDLTRVKFCGEGDLHGSGAAGISKVYTVRFQSGEDVLWQTKVLHDAACPDPVANGQIPVPTKAPTAQYTYEYAGWAGEGSTETKMVPETEFDGFALDPNFGLYYYAGRGSLGLAIGESYRVYWDGEVYDCVAQDGSAVYGSPIAFLGNASAFGLDGHSEPFIIGSDNSNVLIYVADPADTAISHTVGMSYLGAGAVEDSLICITRDMVFRAQFTEAVRYYTVEFYDGHTLVDTVSVPYGGTAKTAYMKTGANHVTWVPSNAYITGDTKCYGQFGNLTFAGSDWADIVAIADAGRAQEVFFLGDTREFIFTAPDGSEVNTTLKIVGFDADTLADGSGKAAVSILCVTSPFIGKLDNGDGAYLWSTCNLRAALNDTVLSAFPEALRKGIKSVTKQSRRYITGSTTGLITTQDKVWIPSCGELGAYTVTSYGVYPEEVEMTYKGVNLSQLLNTQQLNYGRVLTRSANTSNNQSIVMYGSTGWKSAYAFNEGVVPVGFCI